MNTNVFMLNIATASYISNIVIAVILASTVCTHTIVTISTNITNTVQDSRTTISIINIIIIRNITITIFYW